MTGRDHFQITSEIETCLGLISLQLNKTIELYVKIEMEFSCKLKIESA